MNAKSLMTKSPVCCTPDMTLSEVAGMLLDYDCGALPVVDDLTSLHPVGIITDRDIAIRCVAKRLDANSTTAREVMSTPVLTVTEKASLDTCCSEMESHQVRRIVVVDKDGRCCGLIAQADVARSASDKLAGEVIKRISEPRTSTLGSSH